MTALSLLKSKDEVTYLYADSTIRQGLEKMKFHRYSALPVITKEGVYVGCISEGDFLWYIMEHDLKEAEEESILKIIRPQFNPAASIQISITDLLTKAKQQNFIPIIDDRHIFIGMITRRDIIDYFEKLYLKTDIA